MQMKTFKNSDEEFIKAVKECESIRGVLKSLNLAGQGANYRGFHIRVKRLGLDTSHFTGQGHLKGKSCSWSVKKDINDFLVEYSPHNNGNIKRRLIKEGILPAKCCICSIDSWNEMPLSLQMDHINRCDTDNRLENLRLLCPNCHSQTHNFAGRNKGTSVFSKRIKENKPAKIRVKTESVRDNRPLRSANFCKGCSKQISDNAKTCKACVPKTTKIEWPSCETLAAKLAEMSCRALSRELGVSDNAIKKHIRSHGTV